MLDPEETQNLHLLLLKIVACPVLAMQHSPWSIFQGTCSRTGKPDCGALRSLRSLLTQATPWLLGSALANHVDTGHTLPTGFLVSDENRSTPAHTAAHSLEYWWDTPCIKPCMALKDVPCHDGQSSNFSRRHPCCSEMAAICSLPRKLKDISQLSCNWWWAHYTFSI